MTSQVSSADATLESALEQLGVVASGKMSAGVESGDFDPATEASATAVHGSDDNNASSLQETDDNERSSRFDDESMIVVAETNDADTPRQHMSESQALDPGLAFTSSAEPIDSAASGAALEQENAYEDDTTDDAVDAQAAHIGEEVAVPIVEDQANALAANDTQEYDQEFADETPRDPDSAVAAAAAVSCGDDAGCEATDTVAPVEAQVLEPADVVAADADTVPMDLEVADQAQESTTDDADAPVDDSEQQQYDEDEGTADLQVSSNETEAAAVTEAQPSESEPAPADLETDAVYEVRECRLAERQPCASLSSVADTFVVCRTRATKLSQREPETKARTQLPHHKSKRLSPTTQA